MTTESKKLPIIEGFESGPWTVMGDEICNKDGVIVAEVYHIGQEKRLPNLTLIKWAPDLYRLAHEQREVIKQLVDALLRHQNYCRVIDPENFCECMGCQAGRALAASAPFLQED